MLTRHLTTMTLLIGLATAVAIPASAQESNRESKSDQQSPRWKKEFDVEVERIDATDLPEPEESRFPTALQSDAVLPRPTNLSTLKSTASTISPWVVEVIAVTRSATGLKSTPVVLRGHALWVSAKDGGADPVLLTTYNWLQDVDAVFVHPSKRRSEGQLPTADRKRIDDLRADVNPVALLKSGKLVPARVESPDKHRNLTMLAPLEGHELKAERGFALFPFEGQSPTRVYGYSPQMNSALVETQFIEPRTKRKELLFYLHSTYQGILAAPIVTSDGRLVGITAMRHPQEQDRTLVVPPGAIRAYLEAAQGIETPDEDNADEDE